MDKSQDIQFMQRALQLAKIGGVLTMPNPMVGAVIVYNNKIIGEGYHKKYGTAHAEVNAVNSVVKKELLTKSTIYVTLEPCAHFGKTPPCAELLVKTNFKRVVVACKDPFSEVAGKGFELLRNAGIEIEVGICEDEALELNRRFFTFHQQKRPYVILKWAQTSDGFVDRDRADFTETKINWISCPETKVLTHKWRSEESAILVGWNTIKNDNPCLTTRTIHGQNPLRIILDPNSRLADDSNVFSDDFRTIIFTKNIDLVSMNKQYVSLTDYSVKSILGKLFELNILSVIIEGGTYTLQQFIDSNLWDEARVITGEIKFESGKKAPILNHTRETKQLISGTDKINFYQCLS